MIGLVFVWALAVNVHKSKAEIAVAVIFSALFIAYPILSGDLKKFLVVHTLRLVDE